MPIRQTFDHLMSPGRIGQMDLKNRIIMAPMGSNLANTDGHCGARIQRYYEARAKGGAGLVIVGVGAISWPNGACNPNQVAISNDKFIPGLKALVEGVHKHGGKAAIQLQHAGQSALCDIASGREMLVPSVPDKKRGDTLTMLTEDETQEFVSNFTAKGAAVRYHEANKDDISKLIEDFSLAAVRAKNAGFDAVELHASHGYIISSFLSPATNKRSDEYGGSLQNRSRLLVEVIKSVKAAVGENYPVWCRIDATEFRIKNGITIEDAVATAAIVEKAGADAIHVSAYADNSIGIAFTEAPLIHEPGGFIKFSKAVKQAVTIPVIAVGRIEVEVADKHIANNDFDFVAMGRKLLADPELPNKLKQNQAECIRPCIYCYTCVAQIFLNKQVKCAVNPATGNEYLLQQNPVAAAKKVLVIGSGPAGLEAASTAAKHGHNVTLVEKDNRLGGSANFAGLVYEPNNRLVDYLSLRARRSGVDIQLQHKLTMDEISTLNPDKIIVAVGGRQVMPSIPGSQLSHVYTGTSLREIMAGKASAEMPIAIRLMLSLANLTGILNHPKLLRKLSHLWMPLGKRVVMVGGGLVGTELAEFLMERGRTVTVLEGGKHFATDLALPRRWRILTELREHGVKLISGVKIKAISDAGVSYQDNSQQEQFIDADNVIVTLGNSKNDSLAQELKARGFSVASVGDCTGVSFIEGAIKEGRQAAMDL